MLRGNSESKDYCVYVLSDPRTAGDFIYGDVHQSPEEPFYVGQGLIHRPYVHQVEATRSKVKNHKLNKIRRILEEYESYTITYVAIGITRSEALRIEQRYIAGIGRADLGKGPLTNLTDGGDGGLRVLSSAETRRKKSQASLLMHATRDLQVKRRIYEKVSESHVRFLSQLPVAERQHLMERRNAGKQASIYRIHQGYLKAFTSVLSKVFSYKTFAELRALLPAIPHRTLLNLIKEYERDGWITTKQNGANRPKYYLYNLWQ